MNLDQLLTLHFKVYVVYLQVDIELGSSRGSSREDTFSLLGLQGRTLSINGLNNNVYLIILTPLLATSSECQEAALYLK